MESMDFVEAVSLSEQEGYFMSAEGSRSMFDILEHLARGGTIHNLEDWTADEVVAMMGCSWYTMNTLLARNPPE